MPASALLQKPSRRTPLESAEIDPEWEWVRQGLIAMHVLGGSDVLPRDLSGNNRHATGFDTSGISGTLIHNAKGDGREWAGRATGQGIIIPNVALTNQLTVLALISTTGADGDLAAGDAGIDPFEVVLLTSFDGDRTDGTGAAWFPARLPLDRLQR